MAEVAATIAGLDALALRIDDATRQVVADVAHIIQAGGMGHAPVGRPGNSTNLPGDLRRSIMVEGPARASEHSWLARVGPTVVYGRQRELGGAIYPRRARFLRFERYGVVEYSKRVYQRPQPYMRPGYDEGRRPALSVLISRMSAAIEGA